MALLAGDAQSGTGLAGLMKTKLLAGQPITKNEQMTWDTLDALAAAIVEHIVANLEIKGVNVNIDTGGILSAAFTASPVTPTDGGATLKTSMAAAVPANYATGLQNNDGTGLVA